MLPPFNPGRLKKNHSKYINTYKYIIKSYFARVFGVCITSTKTFSCIFSLRFYQEKFEDYPRNIKAIIP